MGYDYFLSETEQRAVRFSTHPGVDILKRAMVHLHPAAAAEQWRATGNDRLPTAMAYAILARCAGIIAMEPERRLQPRTAVWLETQGIMGKQFNEVAARIAPFGLGAKDLRRFFFEAYRLGIERGAEIKGNTPNHAPQVLAALEAIATFWNSDPSDPRPLSPYAQLTDGEDGEEPIMRAVNLAVIAAKGGQQ